MTDNPFFSVIIPTYNRADFIKKTVESVLAQKFSAFEVIVVDDGSTDNTEEVIRSLTDHRIRYFKRRNSERAAARNFGVEQAKGIYVTFLDSDDLLYPNHLQQAKELILQNPKIPAFHLSFDIRTDKGRLVRNVVTRGFINKRILSGNIISCIGVFLERRCALENKFIEDRALSAMEDWELWIRISARHPFLSSPKITSTLVEHDGRSVVMGSSSQIRKKVDLFCAYVSADDYNRSKFQSELRKTTASAKTYAALHLAMIGNERKLVIQYLIKGLADYPGEIFKRRFLIILKFLTLGR